MNTDLTKQVENLKKPACVPDLRTEPASTVTPAHVGQMPRTIRQAVECSSSIVQIGHITEGLTTMFDRLVDMTRPGARIDSAVVNTAGVAVDVSKAILEAAKIQLTATKMIADSLRND